MTTDTEGLSLEQAPPLLIPVSFFLVAPVALIAAGVVLIYGGEQLLWTRFGAHAPAMLHLGTIGFLAAVMLGALYQMIPVVAGARVALVRLAHAVHACLVGGGAALVYGLLESSRVAVLLGAVGLASSLIGFIVPVGVALACAPTRTATVTGMRVAVLGLVTLVVLGVTMAILRGSEAASSHYPQWMAIHVAVGFTVWLGGLITAVSFQVVPMFYLAPAPPRWAERLIVAAIGSSLLALVAAALSSASTVVVALAAAPGAIAVWGLHPLLTLRAIRRRKRRRVDPSVRFWQAGLLVGLSLLPAAALATLSDDSRCPVAFGWLVVWGWAGLIVHGMLSRIVPFLVWFHRFSRLVGHAPVPPMKQLWPPRSAKLGLAVHSTTVLLGLAALAFASDALARAAGGGLVLTGISLGASLMRVLRPRLAPLG